MPRSLCPKTSRSFFKLYRASSLLQRENKNLKKSYNIALLWKLPSLLGHIGSWPFPWSFHHKICLVVTFRENLSIQCSLKNKIRYINSRLPNSFFHYYNGMGRKEKIEDSFTVKIKCSWLLTKHLFLECLIIKPEAIMEKSSISVFSFWQEVLRKLNSGTEENFFLRTVQNSVLFERKPCHLLGKSCIACPA